MSDRQFTFKSDLDGNSNTQTFNVLSNVFGDGYEQHASIGLNNKKGQWSYQRTALKDEILAIKAFFDDHKGADTFLWESPLDGIVRVKTDTSYTPTCLGGNIWRISTTFKQQF